MLYPHCLTGSTTCKLKLVFVRTKLLEKAILWNLRLQQEIVSFARAPWFFPSPGGRWEPRQQSWLRGERRWRPQGDPGCGPRRGRRRERARPRLGRRWGCYLTTRKRSELYSSELYHSELYYSELYHSVLYCSKLHHSELYCSELYCSVVYCYELYRSVLCRSEL